MDTPRQRLRWACAGSPTLINMKDIPMDTDTQDLRGTTQRMGRRRLLAGLGGMAAASLLPAPALAAGSRRLVMTNLHTGESFNEVMTRGSAWHRRSLDRFRNFARDWRTGLTRDIDHRTIEILMDIQDRCGSDNPLVLVSGYRSPQTNTSLSGTAKNSLHMVGQAMDIRHPRMNTSQLHRVAIGLRRGGVGKYSRSGFVHVDCGRLRSWGS